jgi:hypothetical protein
MSAADRMVIGAIVFMFAVIPLYGAFAVLDPLRAPFPLLLDEAGAAVIGIAMLAAAAICAWGVVRRPAPLRIVIAQLLAGTAITIAALLGFDPKTGLLLGLIVLAMGAVGIAVYSYSPLPGATRAFVAALLASGALAALSAAGMALARTPAALYAYHNGRAVGTFINPNELAAYLLVVLGLAAGVALWTRSSRLRMLAFVALIAGLLALGETYSRWGYFSAAAGALFYAAFVGGKRTWIGLGAVVLAAALLVLGPGAGHHNPRDDTSRVVAWTTGIRTWLAFPLTGIGPLAYRRTYDAFRPPEAPGGDAPIAFDPHSLPLAYGSESGLLGFLCLIAGWIVYVREVPRALRGASLPQRALALAFAGGLVALSVHVLINTISIYFVLSLQGAALLLALAQRDLDAAPS